jgi:hypothetical protein
LPALRTVTPLSTARPTAILPGETEVENRYLRYFHEETTGGFQSAWDWTLWNRLMLQGCHHEPFIRDAVIAIGALHKSLRTLSSAAQTLDAGTAQPMAKLHREFAYRKYGTALKKMQLAIDAGSGLRHALIACLLIVCFESHTGNRYKALVHATYGLNILRQRTSVPIGVEEDITDAFRNLDIQITTISDARTPELHESLLSEDSAMARLMPDHFRDLDEAKRYWSIIMRRGCHFMATTWTRTQSSSLAREFQMEMPGSVLVTVGNNIHTTSYKIDDYVKAGQQRSCEEVSRWLKAFEPILNQMRRTSKSTLRGYVAATMLQIQALALKITLAGVVFDQEILYDQFLPDFREILRLAKDIVVVRQSNSKFDFWSGSFLLDLGLVVPLFLVLLRCRDAVLRRQAISILESWHVECWWDPLLIVAIGRFIMEVEEEGMRVDGFIPESSRAILTAKRSCPPQRALLVQCVQRGPGGDLKWTERIVKW